MIDHHLLASKFERLTRISSKQHKVQRPSSQNVATQHQLSQGINGGLESPETGMCVRRLLEMFGGMPPPVG